MQQEILLNVSSREVRFAYLKKGLLYDLIVERKKTRQLTGNIYKGRVTNILHNIQSAFIDIDEGENGFIHITDIIENTKKFEEMFEMNFDIDYDIGALDAKTDVDLDIEQVMKIDQPVLVQVLKEAIGSKGARLTSNISIPGRYLVLLPNTQHYGVSRRIEDKADRERLKKLIHSFEMPKNIGLICRTESKNATSDMLIDEARDLLEIWRNIVDKFNKVEGAALLYEEYDLIRKSVLLGVQKKVDRLLVDHYPTYQRCKHIASKYMKEFPLRVEFYRDKIPIYERFGVNREIEKVLRRKLWLSSGGYLYLEKTEAMYTIDVNSGRYKDENGSSDVEETLVRINMEAAEEIARQLRLRNVGGLIICDFIDMRFKKNQRRVLDYFKECMKDDPARCVILGMSSLGLVEMTRQRNRESLEQTIFSKCPYCEGSGSIKTNESMYIDIERTLYKIINCNQQYGLKLVVHPIIKHHIFVVDNGFLKTLAEELNASLEIEESDELHINEFYFYSTINNEKIEV